MNSPVRFDDSLPIFAALILREWGQTAIDNNLFLRDVTGCLTFVTLDDKPSANDRITLAAKALELLTPYVDGNGFAVATPDELFDDRLKNLQHARKIHLTDSAFNGTVNLVDRRMVGADWLRTPAPCAAPPMRIVFASIKGGVGRSTALCVLAADLAAQGRRVLAIDMDLEAPGLGNMLLPDGTLPEFGLLDYLVEHSFGPLDDQFYVDMIGPSWLGGGRGRVDVIPAIGLRSLKHPANVLAKIARAYLGGNAPDGSTDANADNDPPSFADQMSQLLVRLADPLRYDVILLDARAGLHETTAAAVVGLGAEIFFFGLDQPQTFAGYELLLAHMATLPTAPDDDWRDRLLFIQAKAPADAIKRAAFSEKMEALIRKHLWPVSPSNTALIADPLLGHDMSDVIRKIDPAELKDTFEVEWATPEETTDITLDDDDKPTQIIAITDDSRFQAFDPLTDRAALDKRVYSTAFGDLLEITRDRVNNTLNQEHE
jgi:CobQ/CobB/MinD/ParA nucleotide binding domain